MPNASDDRVSALSGDDIVDGGNGDDFISGGAGKDTLHGNNGSDEILGGMETISLLGNNSFTDAGGGSDRYIFGSTGNTTIYDLSGNDTLDFSDLSVAEVKFKRSSNNLTIIYDGTDNTTEILNFFNGGYIEKSVIDIDGARKTVSNDALLDLSANNAVEATDLW